MQTTDVVIAHPHAFFRHGLRAALDTQHDLYIAGDAGSGQEALVLIERIQPALLVVALDLPGAGGIEIARSAKRVSPATGIVALTQLEEPRVIVHALAAGIAAILPTSVGPTELIPVLRTVHAGDYPINDVVLARRDLATAVLATVRTYGESLPFFAPLTPREVAVLELVAAGRTNKEIGQVLCIGDQTVKTHVGSILEKLGVSDRTQAVIAAVRNKWITVALALAIGSTLAEQFAGWLGGGA